ncbi:MAG: hypothetical protein ACLQLC_11815 [Candidatus Sulfotelmatobacter sp.]
MKWRAGILYSITGLLAGYAAFSMMMQTVNGGPWSWWGPVMLGAAILLMVAGIRPFATRLAVGWLVATAAATPLAICAAFGTWPPRCCFFALSVGAFALIIFKADVTVGHGDIAAFLASFLLAASLIPVSVNTVRAYLSPNVANPSLAVPALLLLLFFWVLIIATLLRSGSTVFRRPSVR